ncbi:glycosyltransferase [Chroogloeocystis siderophila]|jgi:colanic acid/amylovoran biosynthesis glycosyltransferase|uniref:Glycosyl transferase family 1 n=1 Tax=Chroogloeocystis siderophila 5.2 s.c.1 TaxID=247279 RepID=A0A1U7HE24_9CHRO|nr:glycosyltransferase [Chroogloeocystis siderophila]OKH21791.1 glycosyl transferase family 1 [Chroogloeocystis siderophila 5.2 s.c.1]
MKNIGIYRRVFPLTSEAFIQEQSHNMMRYQPTFISNTLLQEVPFNSIAVSQNDLLGIKQATFLLTRSPKLFNRLDTSTLALIHAHFGPDGVYAIPIAEKLKIPLLVTFHGYDITISRTALWRKGKFLYYQLIFHEEELKRKAAKFIAVSNFIKNKLLEKKYPNEKIIQHYIGVDTEKFTPGKKASERYILCVGRHTQKKGIDTLLHAFAKITHKHPEVSLIQVGTGNLTNTLYNLTKTLDIAHRVRFLGAQPHEVVLNLMRGAEVFALASQTAENGDCEGLPIVINEASACGIPVVSTWHSGIPEAILDGETGFLVAEQDDINLAEKLDLLLSDRALGEKMGQRGREFMCEMFDIRKQTSKLEAIYDSLS